MIQKEVYKMINDSQKLARRLKLYLICGEGLTPEETLRKSALALDGGVTAVQLRVKSWTARECLRTAEELRKICHAHGALFFVNDRLDIALAAGADGVHLGQSDLPVPAARRIAGSGFIIGASSRTRELAAEAQRAGADYIGCGAAFGTSTKKDASVIGPEGIKCALSSTQIPAVAIGGINAGNIALLEGCGACGAAVSGALLNARDPEAEARKLIKEADRIFSKTFI